MLLLVLPVLLMLIALLLITPCTAGQQGSSTRRASTHAGSQHDAEARPALPFLLCNLRQLVHRALWRRADV